MCFAKIRNFFANKDNKITATIFLATLTLNLILMSIMTFIPNTENVNGVYFDFDNSRVYSDMTIRDYNHYRTTVHPLFVILTQPPVLILSKILSSKLLAAIIFQSLIAAANLTLFYLILKKITQKTKISIILSSVFYLLFTQVIFVGVFETYVYAQFGLLLMWYFLVKKIDANLKTWDYVVLLILGVLTISVTITNFVQYLIFLSIIILFNQKEKTRIVKFVAIVVSTVGLAVLASQIQNIIWPSAPEFLKSNLVGFLRKDSEEFLYIDRKVNVWKLLNQVQVNTVDNFAISSVIEIKDNNFFYTNSSKLFKFIGVGIFSIIIFIQITFISRLKKAELKKHKLYFGLATAFIFNFLLHLVYGNDTAFLYTPHYNFLLLLTIFYSVINLKPNSIIKKIIYSKGIILYWIYVVIQLVGLVAFFDLVFSNLGFDRQISIKLLVIILFSCGLLGLVVANYLKKQMLIPVALIAASSLIGFFIINNQVVNGDITFRGGLTRSGQLKDIWLKYPEGKQALRNLSDYYKEIDVRLVEQVNYRFFENTNRKAANFFFFGLADRTKMVYKDGKIYDLFTQKIIKEWNIKESLIIPNEYTVLMIDEHDKLVKVYENEAGVFVKTGDQEELLSKGKESINLLDFDGHKYKNILKVLHQELLFHFDQGVPKPNIVMYKQTGGWYRDAMILAIALNRTDNTHLLEKWVASLTDIYDYQRHPDLKEADNPGQLLYILGIVKNNRNDLIKKIQNEVKMKAKDGHFSGPCDGSIQTYYPTALLLAGAEKTKVDLPVKLTLPKNDDAYGRITWWHQDRTFVNNKPLVSISFPYLEWAQYNYSPYNVPHLLNESYPLTYEKTEPEDGDSTRQSFYNEFYANKKMSISHAWHAAEMFLALIDK